MYVTTIKEALDFGVGEQISLIGRINAVEVKKTTAGAEYIDFKLVDINSEIPVKLWEANQHDIDTLQRVRYIKVAGVISAFRGAKQIIIQSYYVVDESTIDTSKYIKTAPESVESLVNVIEDCIASIDDRAIKSIVETRWNKNKDKFIQYPAARGHHHNYQTGLLYHTVEEVPA